MKTLSLEDFQSELRAQGVPTREDAALKCPICGTVQSMRSLVAAGVDPAKAETYIGFSCEGRFNGAAPASRDGKPGKPGVRGCDWTLGGLFKLHNLEVTKDGKSFPVFEPATPAEAQALARGEEA